MEYCRTCLSAVSRFWFLAMLGDWRMAETSEWKAAETNQTTNNAVRT
jgi:hypothetical protein